MTGQARAKLLLFGEHSAVYGHPAVGVSLPWFLSVSHTPAPRWELPGLGYYESVVRTLIDRLGTLADEISRPRPLPGRLDFVTGIPVGNGFGSSGALCAALVNLFFPKLPLTEKDLLAWRAEALFHGTPSGIDTALALRTGWWSLDASTRPVTATKLPDPSLILVVGAVVRPSATKTLVEALASRKAAREPLVVETLKFLGETAGKAAALVQAGRAADLPPLVNQARTGLRVLDLESQALTSALDCGLACRGALAGKLSGAGGGGAFFLVFDSEENARQAIPAIEQSVGDSEWTCRPRVIAGSSE